MQIYLDAGSLERAFLNLGAAKHRKAAAFRGKTSGIEVFWDCRSMKCEAIRGINIIKNV